MGTTQGQCPLQLNHLSRVFTFEGLRHMPPSLLPLPTGVTQVQAMVDVGCGIGGSSRHIVRKFPGATARGITLSPKQAARANEITAAAGLGAQASFQASHPPAVCAHHLLELQAGLTHWLCGRVLLYEYIS
jgi:trans-aconitate methyltransferase